MTAIQVRVLDSSIAGKLTNQQPYDVIVKPTMTVSDAVSAVLSRASDPMSRLTLIAHGYGALVEGNIVPDHGVSVPLPGPSNVSRAGPNVSRIYGGYGLDLGKDDLNMRTASAFSRLNGHFTEGAIIVIFGCAAGDHGPYLGERLSGDGPALMRAIAQFAGVPVRAADSLQEVPVNWYLDTADRGPWVGRTLLFMPDGRQVDESTLPMSVY
jgi:hypothetical protein